MMRLAVDVGGTFTDVVAIDDATGRLYVLKVRSTPAAPERGLLSSLERLLSANGLPPSTILSVVQVSTIGTNLFLGQIGIGMPKTALIATKGFRDVLEIGRQNRAELYNVFFQRPKPLIPRKHRFEVSERVDSNGTTIRKVSADEVEHLAKKLRDESIESVAISFINSYLNSENEIDAKRAICTVVGTNVFASSEIDPEHREYERTSTTVVNAVLAPVVSRYLQIAMQGMRDLGVNAPLQILSSSGGLVDVKEVTSKPVVAVESGPAAGVVGAAEIARLLGIGHAISLDMGGTTAKAGCVVDYRPLIVPEMEIGGRIHLGRLVKGSGYPVRYACVDLAEVSAGGGTIIWADEVGALRVGPISAGAEPGPACYGAGGNDATITDANLMLGRLGSTLLGGELRLVPRLAEEALDRVGSKIGMTAQEVAAASLKLINLHMARAVDIVSLERGLDPRQFALVAFGGAGPMHAAELAEHVGINTVIVPLFPGLFSALGMLMTDMKYAYVKGTLKLLDDLADDSVEELYRGIADEALEQLKARGIDISIAEVMRSVDLRYLGQGYELDVAASTPFDKSKVAEKFETKHEMVYGYRHDGEKLELTALRLTVIIPIKKPSLSYMPETASVERDALRQHRKVWLNRAWTETPVFWRNGLPGDVMLRGPAIVEEYDSTVVVPPNWDCGNTEMNCLVLERRNPR